MAGKAKTKPKTVCVNCGEPVKFTSERNPETNRLHTYAEHGTPGRSSINPDLLSRRHKRRLLQSLGADCKKAQRSAKKKAA